MLFNSDPVKQAIAVYFSRKSHSGNIQVISFNNIPVASRHCQKQVLFWIKSWPFIIILSEQTTVLGCINVC